MIGFVSFRYAFSRSSGQRGRAIRAMITIALSLVAVTVVMSVMEFLQEGRFNDIRDVRSFSVIVEGRHKEEIQQLFPDSTVFEYGEGEALHESGAYMVRYIDSDYDGGLNYFYGDASSLLIPYTRLSSLSSKVTLSMLRKGKVATTMKNVEFTVSGIYWTKLGKEFDDTMLFLPMSHADETVNFVTALKGVDSQLALSRLEEIGLEGVEWKEAESSLYAAFLVEKTMMYGVLSLLFIIIMVSMKQSVRIFVSSRRKESAELEILGLSGKRVLLVTEWAFLMILILGILLGIALGVVSLVVLEKLSLSSPSIMDMTLSLPKGGLLFFSSFLMVFTVISVMWESRRKERGMLWEVINGK